MQPIHNCIPKQVYMAETDVHVKIELEQIRKSHGQVGVKKVGHFELGLLYRWLGAFK